MRSSAKGGRAQERRRRSRPSSSSAARRTAQWTSKPLHDAEKRFSLRSWGRSGSTSLGTKGLLDAVADAEAFVARLLPGWTPDEAPSAEWRQLFVEQGVSAQTLLEDDSALLAPQEMVAIGRSVLALSYAAGDSLSALRALGGSREDTWSRAASTSTMTPPSSR